MSSFLAPTIGSPITLDWGYGLGAVTIMVSSYEPDDFQDAVVGAFLVTGIVTQVTGDAAENFALDEEVEVLWFADAVPSLDN